MLSFRSPFFFNVFDFFYYFRGGGGVCGVITCYVMLIDRWENFVVEQNNFNEEILVTFWQILCIAIATNVNLCENDC